MSALRPVAAVTAVACAFLLVPDAARASKSPSPMVDQINKMRTAHGVPPARYSRSLSESSSRFSRHLARTHRFAHDARIIASRRFAKVGEILALTWGWDIRRRQTLGYWLNSPRHRAVLLGRSFRYAGAARIRGDFEGKSVLFWTVQFGR